MQHAKTELLRILAYVALYFLAVTLNLVPPFLAGIMPMAF